MPGWQRWYEQSEENRPALLSVASDMGGEAAIRPWTERAKATFPTVMDADNVFGALLGFKAIPNGVLLDPQGIIRYAKYGGFEVTHRDDLAAVEAAMQAMPGAPSDEAPAEPVAAPSVLTGEQQARVAALLHEGTRRIGTGDRAAGLAAWREALALDPANFVIRKQLWRADHPERFGETIDFDWQREQLAAERAREAAR